MSDNTLLHQEEEGLSFTVSNPWAPRSSSSSIRAAKPPAVASTFGWCGAAVALLTFALGGFIMLASDVLEEPRSRAAAQPTAVASASALPPILEIDTLDAPDAATPPPPVMAKISVPAPKPHRASNQSPKKARAAAAVVAVADERSALFAERE
jgi:hypothetical protein